MKPDDSLLPAPEGRSPADAPEAPSLRGVPASSRVRPPLERAVRAVAARLRQSSAEETAREARARRAVEGLLAAALVASVVDLAVGVSPTAAGSGAACAGAACAGAACAGAACAGASDAAAAPIRSIPIDLAHDPPWALRLLPSIGRTRAAAIVLDRARAGPLPSLGALARVPGFGPKSREALEAAGAVVRGSTPGPDVTTGRASERATDRVPERAPDPEARPP